MPSDTRPRRVLVTGGTGFIGTPLVSRLLAAGHQVTAASQDPHADTGAELAVVDLLDAGATRSLIHDHDLIVHLAARQGGIQFQQRPDERVLLDNVRMTSNVLRAATSTGAERVVLASSAVVYSRQAESPISEPAPLVDPQSEPITPYAWSKVTDEVAAGWARDRGLDVLVARFTNVYGPRASLDEDSSTVVHALVRRSLELAPGADLRVWGDGSAERSFVHVEDAAAAVTTILTHGAAGATYNVSTTGPVTIGDLAAMVRELAAPDARLAFDTTAPGGVRARSLDHTALHELGFSPRHELRDGLATVIADARRRLGM